MSKSQAVREQDVRAMLKLMAEITQLPPHPGQRIEHLLAGIMQLLDARAVWTTRYRSAGPGHQVQPYGALQIGFSPQEFDAAMRIAAIDPIHDFVNNDMHAEQTWPAVFVTRRIATERKRERREPAARNREEVGGDLDLIINCPTGEAHHFAGLGLQRAAGERTPFSDREIQIARLLWEQARFLHAKPLAGVQEQLWGAQLPRRAAEVLDLLLTGQSAKQIARRLGLSHHTVNDHLKDLYRRFGVASRGELMAVFVR
jgi:DNA-binding CsgD family transcriptional regulator